MKILYLILGSCLVATFVFAAAAKDKVVSPAVKEKEKPTGRIDSKVKRPNEMTAGELAEVISDILDWNEEILGYIPGFKCGKDSAGKNFYTYKGVRLENIDKVKLAALYSRIRQEQNRLNTERINKQLESIRQAQQAANVASQGASRIPVITAPPRPPSPVPAPPPQAPRMPPPAPPPTQRR